MGNDERLELHPYYYGDKQRCVCSKNGTLCARH
jgi:hypothetical protein